MYDSPKAAHFIASRGDGPLKWNDEDGLRVRWMAARRLEDAGIHNMLDVFRDDRLLAIVDKVVADVREETGISLALMVIETGVG